VSAWVTLSPTQAATRCPSPGGHPASTDFLTVPTATFRVLYVFLVLSHDRRRVVDWNVTSHPGALWTAQQNGENLHGRVEGMRIEEVLTAPRSPWQNPYAERLVGSVRRECLDHVIVLGERHCTGS
jgi:putative transposase